MKQLFPILAAACLLLSGCGSKAKTQEKTPQETVSRTQSSGLNIDMSQYSDQAKLLTAGDGIYLGSSRCGYWDEFGNDTSFIIHTQEQLDVFNSRYGMNEKVPVRHTDGESDTEYDLEHYDLVMEYFEVGSGGYNLKAGGLLVDTDTLFFVDSPDSKRPDGDTVTAVMDGFWFVAAVPKGTLLNERYSGWTYFDAEAPEITDPPMPLETVEVEEVTNPGMPVDENGNPEMTNPAMPVDDAD